MLNNLPSSVILDLTEELFELFQLSNDPRFKGIDIPDIVYKIFEAINCCEVNERNFILVSIINDLSYEEDKKGKFKIEIGSDRMCKATVVINNICNRIEDALKRLSGSNYKVLCYIFDRMVDETSVMLTPFSDAYPDNYPL